MWVVCQWSLTRGYADIFATAIIIVKIYVFFYTANILKKYFCKQIMEKFADIFATANITDITMFVAMHIFPHIFSQKICGKSRSDVSEWVRVREAII